MSAPTFFIAGYWGFGNVGDEAVLAVTISDIRSLFPDARIIVTSERPTVTETMHGVEAVGWRALNEFLPALSESDHVIVGGGGLWNSYFSPSLTTILSDTSNYAEHIYTIPAIARLLEKPVTIYCVGGGVINGDAMRELAALGLACASRILVRDRRTLEFFQNDLAVSQPLVVGDPAFRLQSATTELDGIADVVSWADREQPLIAVVRPWMGYSITHLAKHLEPVLASASRLLGKPVLFISFDQAMHDADELSDDAQLIQAVCSHLPEDIRTRTFTEEVHPSSILRLIESATAVISMRLHGCILAASAAKPLLALECDAKVGAVLSDIGLEDHVVKLSAMNPTVCDAVLVRAMTTAGLAVSSSAADYAKVLSSQAPPLLAKAVAEATVPAVPSALSNLVPRLVSRSLRTHSLVTQNLPLFATVARDAVNGGNVKLARAMLAILRMYDAECGEWYYLEAVANASEGGPSDYTFTMLEKARVLGFDETWIRYVRACTLVRIGRLEAAIAERDAARAAAGSHPAIPSFDAAF